MDRVTITVSQESVERLLAHEAWCLDGRHWDQWLSLYLPDACFWVPSWRSEYDLVRDPRNEASLIYAGSRERLAERVRRIQQAKTPTAQPLPRTLHQVTNVLILEDGHGEAGSPARVPVSTPQEIGACEVAACWTVFRYDTAARRTDVLYGRYEYRLRQEQGQLRIASKVVQLLNDCVPTYIDFYSV